MLDQYSGKLKLEFSKSYPNNIKLYDFVENTMNLLIISDRVKVVFDGLGINGVEYIPSEIYDHKENLVGANYYVINTLSEQPIIDLNKSDVVMSRYTTLLLTMS